MWEWVTIAAKRGGKLFWIELFVPGGTLIVLAILLGGLVWRSLRSGGSSTSWPRPASAAISLRHVPAPAPVTLWAGRPLSAGQECRR